MIWALIYGRQSAIDAHAQRLNNIHDMLALHIISPMIVRDHRWLLAKTRGFEQLSDLESWSLSFVFLYRLFASSE